MHMLLLTAMLAASAALAGCSTATPIVVRGESFASLSGRASTTGGYTGAITTENRTCRGSYTGLLGLDEVPLEMSCQDGRHGIGRARLDGNRFVSGEVRLNDGTRLTLQADGPTFP